LYIFNAELSGLGWVHRLETAKYGFGARGGRKKRASVRFVVGKSARQSDYVFLHARAPAACRYLLDFALPLPLPFPKIIDTCTGAVLYYLGYRSEKALNPVTGALRLQLRNVSL